MDHERNRQADKHTGLLWQYRALHYGASCTIVHRLVKLHKPAHITKHIYGNLL